MTRLSTPVLAIVVAAVLASCGGEDTPDVSGADTAVSQQELEQAVRDARDEVAAVTEDLRGAGSGDELARRTGDAADRLRERAEDVEQAAAAEGLEEPRDRLASSLHDLAADLESARADAEGENWQAAAAAVLEGGAMRDVERALADLRERGLDVEGFEPQADGDLSAQANRVQAELSQLLQELAGARTPDEVGEAMEDAATRLRDAAADVEAADADPQLEDARDETADAARRLADELEAAAPAARQADLAQAAADARALSAVADLRRALSELRQRGVDVEETEGIDVEDAARSARDEVDRTLGDVAQARSPSDLADRMEEGAARIRDAADQVEQAEAESDVEPAQQQLADALRSLEAELEQAAPDVRQGDFATALRRAQALEAVNEVEEALEELRRQGVDVPAAVGGS